MTESNSINEPAPNHDPLESNRVALAETGARSPRGEPPARPSSDLGPRPAPVRAAGLSATNPISSSPTATAERSPTNAPAGAPRPEFAPFKLIADRNIFDPNRVPHRPGDGPAPKPKVTEFFGLVGTMSYAKGAFAFFNGSNSDFKKALKPADTIGGYKLTDIEPDSVMLTEGTNAVQLRVGMQMRREEGGAWLLATQAESYAASGSTGSSGASSSAATAASTPATSSSAELSEVEKRMMQRREQ
ncbi:MAG: hypothetical protein KGS61_06025 [Verrucomicrobia bacterium]|nr:hypothetical protein [Verrucomicrobiota bacterium]